MNSVPSTSEKTPTEHVDNSQNVSHSQRRLSCLLILLLGCVSLSFVAVPWIYFVKHPEKFETCMTEAMTEAMYRYFVHTAKNNPSDPECDPTIPNYATTASETDRSWITLENPRGYAPQSLACLQCQMRLQFLASKMGVDYTERNHNAYLPAYTVNSHGNPLHSWRVLILPYIGEEELYQQIRLDEPWNSDHNRTLWNQMPKVYHCPALGEKGNTTPYCMIVGTHASRPASQAGDANGIRPEDITGGTAFTLMLAERKTPVNWMEPIDILQEDAEKGVNVCPDGIGSEHPNGAGAATYFWEPLFIPNDADLQILREAITITGSRGSNYEIPNSWRLEQFSRKNIGTTKMMFSEK